MGGVKQDAFADLSRFQLNPEQARKATAIKPSRRKHYVGNFYLVPVEWAERAMEAVSSKQQLMLALRFYRRWRMRRADQETLTASNQVLAGPGFGRHTKRKTIIALEKAGLIEVVERRKGRSPRVRTIE